MKKKVIAALLACCVTVGAAVGVAEIGKSGALQADAAATLKFATSNKDTQETETADSQSSEEASSEASSGKKSDKAVQKSAGSVGNKKDSRKTEESAGAATAEETEKDAAKSDDTAADTPATLESTEKDPGAQVTVAADAATITVTGTGTSTVTPDKAVLTLGVENTDTSSKTAQDQNAKIINNVIDVLINDGIDKDKISTSSYDLYANYDYTDGARTMTGYTAITMLTIKDVDVSGVGELVDDAGDAGVNVINGFTFQYSETEEAYDQALEAALERAQTKASKIAGKQGCKLGKVVSISENSDANYYSSDARAYAANETESADEAMNVMPGENTITATVTVVYELAE